MRSILSNKKSHSRSYFESEKNLLKSKRSAEMAIGTIVVIILALIVLIFLVFGFSQGWNNIWEKILNFGGGDSNVGTVVQACQAACATQDPYAYCGQVRTLKISKEDSRIGSCKTLSGITNTGFPPCDIDCTSFKLKICSDLAGSWISSTECKGKTDLTSQVQDNSVDSGYAMGKVCCK